MHSKYVLGIDFGTLSARALLVSLATGAEVAVSEQPYRHGVIDDALPVTGTPLPPMAVRQHPDDYIESMVGAVRDAVKKARISAREVVALGIDATSCTLLPVAADGRPLARQAAFADNPDAWVHLWKDQTAQSQAEQLTERARAEDQPFLPASGNKIAADTMYPKVWQIARRSPDVFHAAHRFLEIGDWLVQWLTGTDTVGLPAAGFKALWTGSYPESFLADVDPDLGKLVRTKLSRDFTLPGQRAGVLSAPAAERLGLTTDVVVAGAHIDAHSALPGAGVSGPETMVLVMGTSMCHMVLTEENISVPGIVGAVPNGILPGYVGYEAGQPAVGDLFAWYVDHALPASYTQEASRRHMSTYAYLESLVAAVRPGQSGLLALDWWNGNRSPLSNGDLSGVVIGYSLHTRPEHVFRALMESVAFGTRDIIGTFADSGVAVRNIVAGGGIAVNSPLMMQIMADVTGRPIALASSRNTSALGAAIMGALAYEGNDTDVQATINRLTRPPQITYEPNGEFQPVYDALYEQYKHISRYFAGDGLHVMDTLRRLATSPIHARAVT